MGYQLCHRHALAGEPRQPLRRGPQAARGPLDPGRRGEVLPHVGAVHREGVGKAHLHLGIVRDKFTRGELKALKERTDALAMEFGRRLEMGLKQDMEREELVGPELGEGGVTHELSL